MRESLDPKIREAITQELPLARTLFSEYADSLDFDLSFQGFAEELASLPGEYSAPRGCLLLAFEGRELLGCVALRPLSGGNAEMKRLYVREKCRGSGIGRALARAVMEKAAQKGYGKIRLDTVPAMAAAIRMYQSLGFYPIPPYRENPVRGASYWECDLSDFR